VSPCAKRKHSQSDDQLRPSGLEKLQQKRREEWSQSYSKGEKAKLDKLLVSRGPKKEPTHPSIVECRRLKGLESSGLTK